MTSRFSPFSVSAAIEHLVAGSQGVITKRIDLALLEGQELLSRTFRGAAFLGFGMVMAAGAWFAAATALVGLHLYLVQRHGMSVPIDVEAPATKEHATKVSETDRDSTIGP